MGQSLSRSATFVRFFTSVALGCAALSTFGAEPREWLVQDGRPASVIVLPAQPNPVERYAAQELSEHFAKASGATVPVHNEDALGGAATARRIYLGNTRAARSAGLDGTKLPRETFTLRSADNALFPALSKAFAWSLCVPFCASGVFHMKLYGADVFSPAGVPSMVSSTF